MVQAALMASMVQSASPLALTRNEVIGWATDSAERHCELEDENRTSIIVNRLNQADVEAAQKLGEALRACQELPKPGERVSLFSTVVMEDLSEGGVEAVFIVPTIPRGVSLPPLLYADQELEVFPVSQETPCALALLGKEPGDVVVYRVEHPGHSLVVRRLTIRATNI